MTALDDQVRAILAGTPGFLIDPRNLSTMFQDSAGSIPVTTSGQPVARVNTQGGTTVNNYFNSTVAAQPTLTSPNAILGDGVDDFLNGPTPWAFNNMEACFVCFEVEFVTLPVGTGGLFGFSNNQTVFFQFTVAPNGSCTLTILGGLGPPASVAGLFAAGVKRVVTLIADWTTEGRYEVYIDGAAVGSVVRGPSAAPLHSNVNRHRVLSTIANVPLAANAKLGRLVLSNQLMTPAARATIEAWVAETDEPPPLTRTLNFPTGPVLGQVFEAEGASFIWNGSLWVVLSAASFPWATAAEAIAGARADLAISPLTLKAAMDARGYTFKGNIQQQPVDLAASGQRVGRTIYQNDTGRSLLVALVMRPVSGGGTFYLRLGASSADMSLAVVGETGADTNRRRSALAVVPPGWFYQADLASGNIEIQNWNEYRG